MLKDVFRFNRDHFANFQRVEYQLVIHLAGDLAIAHGLDDQPESFSEYLARNAAGTNLYEVAWFDAVQSFQ